MRALFGSLRSIYCVVCLCTCIVTECVGDDILCIPVHNIKYVTCKKNISKIKNFVSKLPKRKCKIVVDAFYDNETPAGTRAYKFATCSQLRAAVAAMVKAVDGRVLAVCGKALPGTCKTTETSGKFNHAVNQFVVVVYSQSAFPEAE